MGTPICEHGKNAHGKTVEAGRYVVYGGRLLFLDAKAPLKAGMRLATQGDIDAAKAAEAARSSKESKAQADADGIERARCDEEGDEVRARQAGCDALMEAKKAAQKPTVLAPAEPAAVTAVGAARPADDVTVDWSEVPSKK